MRRKLTDKLKSEISSNYSRLKQSDFSGDALAYLIRVRAAHKGAKTKQQKKDYQSKRRLTKGPAIQSNEMISVAAASMNLTEKQFRKKFPGEVADFERDMKIFYDREIDNLKDDLKFLPKGKYTFVNGKRIKKDKAVYLLTRLKNTILSTGKTAEKISVEHWYDGKGNVHFNIPVPSDTNDMGDAEHMLNYIKENFPFVRFYYS